MELDEVGLSLPLLAFQVASNDRQSIGVPSLYVAFGLIV